MATEKSANRTKMSLTRITPSMARKMLRSNNKNRHFRSATARKYAAEITAGRWKVNGESIKFDADGILIDGQHRLEAVVMANESIEMYVLRGLSKDAYDTIDIGKKRTVADVFSREGLANYSTLSSSLSLVHWYENECNLTNQLSTTIAMKFLSEHELLKASCTWSVKFKQHTTQFIPMSVVAFVHYYASKQDPDIANAFWERVLIGEGLRRGMPELTFRNKLMQVVRITKQMITSHMACAFAIKSWNASLEGRALTKLYWGDTEEYPRFSQEAIR